MSAEFQTTLSFGATETFGHYAALLLTAETEGGAHPQVTRQAYLVDAQIGKVLAFGDIFVADTAGLLGLAIEKQSDAGAMENFPGWNDMAKGVMEDARNWLFRANSADLLFDPYTIAPYFVGQRDIRFTADELAPFLKADLYGPTT